MVKRSYFNFKNWYKMNKTLYGIEISAIWLENILNAVFFSPYPCLSAALDYADFKLFEWRNTQEAILNPYPTKDVKKVSIVNDIVYSANIFGDGAIAGYHCINNGWAGLAEWKSEDWGIMTIKNADIKNFDYTDPSEYFYLVQMVSSFYLAAAYATEDKDSLIFTMPRVLSSTWKAVVTLLT